MIKQGKRIKRISLILLGIGIVLLGIGLITGGQPGFSVNYNMNKKSFRIVTEKDYQEEILEKSKIEEFDSIKIDVKYKDIIFKSGDDYYIDYVSNTMTGVNYSVKNGTLYIEDKSENVINFIYYKSKKEQVTIYLPEDVEFTDLNLKVYEGNVTMGNIISATFKLNQKYGKFQAEEVQADQFDIDLYEGDFQFEKLTGETLVLNSKYTNLMGEQLEVTNIKAKTYEGDTRIGEISILVFDLKSKYGDINLGFTESAGDYTFDLQAKYGTIKINNQSNGENYSSTGNSDYEITISSYEGNQIISTK